MTDATMVPFDEAAAPAPPTTAKCPRCAREFSAVSLTVWSAAMALASHLKACLEAEMAANRDDGPRSSVCVICCDPLDPKKPGITAKRGGICDDCGNMVPFMLDQSR